jgi:poly(A) polymerase
VIKTASKKAIAAAHEVVDKLRGKGHEAYFAGGYVRDLLLGRDASDVDVVTSATPDKVKALFKRTIEVGIQFGIVVAVIGEERVEIATFRTESGYEDGRRPTQVAFASAREDASRRDFTVNGIFWDPDKGEAIDFVGGRDDLRRGVVRAIGDPDARFDEDKLRILRAPRFAAKLRFRLDEATASAARRRAAEVARVSAERIRDELDKMLLDPSRAHGLDLLLDLAIAPVVLPELDAAGLARSRRVIGVLPARTSRALAWAALLAPAGAEKTEAALARLRASNKDAEAATALVRDRADARRLPELPLSAQKRLLLRDDALDLLELARAEALVDTGDLAFLAFARARRQAFVDERGVAALASPPLLRGQDLFAAGLAAGPRFRELLQRAEDARLEGRARTKEEALAVLRSEVPEAFR